VSNFIEMKKDFESMEMMYIGESNMYFRFIGSGVVSGYSGNWLHSESGGIVFNPMGTRSCFSSAPMKGNKETTIVGADNTVSKP